MRTVPGAIAFDADARAPELERGGAHDAIIPAFDAEYAAPNGIAVSPDTDAMCTMLPPVPCASSWFATVRVVKERRLQVEAHDVVPRFGRRGDDRRPLV